MSVQTPQFNTPQGSPTDRLEFVSTIRKQVLTGTLSGNVVDIQVNVNGAGFVSDPALVEFTQNEFTVPNQNVYPEGFTLEFGANTIEVRAIGVTGAVSSVARAIIRILRPEELNLVSSAPSGLRVRRRKDAVELVWAETDIPDVRGYHIYASSEPGGGSEGYVRLNRDIISDAAFEEENLFEITEDSTFYNNNFGQLNINLTEVDFNEEPIQTVQESLIDTSLSGPEVKVTTKVESVVTNTYFSFKHDREGTEQEGFINNEVFSGLPSDEPLYYVMTTVVYNPVTNQEIESAYSSELVGIPLEIDTQLRDIPRRTRFDVTEEYIERVINYDNEISVMPGSIVKDVFIDPFATEAERLYFIADFVRRSQSFATLLVVDELASYKQALASAMGFRNTANVQQIIDDSFDKLAANTNKIRLGSQPAVGTVTFFTSTEPQNNLVVEEGTLVPTQDGSATFRVTSRVTLPVDSRDSYFNLQRKRWEITANVVATTPGEVGNVPAGQITRVIVGASNLQVTNLEATRFGRNEESNQDLAERSMLSFASVDAGTKAGYLSTALGQVGVFRAKIIDAGHTHMVRDYDEVREKHIGGKVDVWVQGDQRVEVEDTFALRFRVERDVRFFLDSVPSQYIFVVDDDRVTPENPITQLLGETPEEQAQGFGFRNLTTGLDFDLTNYTLLSYNRIQLNTNIPQPSISPNNVVIGDFRFRETDEYVFSRQPVLAVNTIQSINSDDILTEGTHYEFFRDQDPLLEGYSTRARDYLLITEKDGVPSGDVIDINDERHVLVGEIPEALINLGVTPFSVRVFSLDRATEYNGPLTADPDFFIQEGSDTEPLRIVRNPDGDIDDGSELSIDYEHDENFQISYTINEVLANVQRKVDIERHVTADVLAKQAVQNLIDLEMTIVLSNGAVQSQVDIALRTNISQLMNSKGVGTSVHQSDIVRVIENTPGVDYVIVPFARMSHANGNLIVREEIDSSFVFLEDTLSNVSLYALQDSLSHQTISGGGSPNQHRGVFQDRQPLRIVSTYASLMDATGSALVVGSEGLIIPNYSDDQTLLDAGFLTPEARAERRLELTANRVFISLNSSSSPEDYSYTASYEVRGDKESRSSIELMDVAFAELGNLTITYR